MVGESSTIKMRGIELSTIPPWLSCTGTNSGALEVVIANERAGISARRQGLIRRELTRIVEYKRLDQVDSSEAQAIAAEFNARGGQRLGVDDPRKNYLAKT